jgi:hypothetical protein
MKISSHAVHAIAVATTLLSGAFAAQAQVVGTHCLTPLSAGAFDFARYGVTGNGMNGNISTLMLPNAKDVFQLPISTVVCPASAAHWTLQADGTFVVNDTGLYRVTMVIDHPAQGGDKRGSNNPNGLDVDLRTMSVGLLPVGVKLTGVMKGGLLDIQLTKYTRMASQDMPGSDSPVVSRGSVAFSGATVSPNQGLYFDIPLTDTGLIAMGDTAVASLTSLTDAMGVAANNAVSVTARVIAADKIRVFIDVVRGGAAVTIPAGTINAMASAAVNSRGQSADAWSTLTTPSMILLKGETVFFAWKSVVPNDYLQVTNMTYAQLEYLGAAESNGTGGQK